MTKADDLQNAANLHAAMCTMNALRGDKQQAERDLRNAEMYGDWASLARIKEGRGI